jgi:hypothetical protein
MLGQSMVAGFATGPVEIIHQVSPKIILMGRFAPLNRKAELFPDD